MIVKYVDGRPGRSLYQHCLKVIVTDLEDELVLLDLVSKQMFSLNVIGRVLWLELPRYGLEATVGRITAAFDVAPETAHADAVVLIEHLTANKLLEVANVNA
jgi:hypothetical protein